MHSSPGCRRLDTAPSPDRRSCIRGAGGRVPTVETRSVDRVVDAGLTRRAKFRSFRSRSSPRGTCIRSIDLPHHLDRTWRSRHDPGPQRIEPIVGRTLGCSSWAMNIVGTPYSAVQRSPAIAAQVRLGVEGFGRKHHARAVHERRRGSRARSRSSDRTARAGRFGRPACIAGARRRRSRCSAMLRCDSVAPFGNPVVPDVY